MLVMSDRPRKNWPKLKTAFVRGFEWGLIADIQPPDLETKVAILQKKAENDQVQLPTT